VRGGGLEPPQTPLERPAGAKRLRVAPEKADPPGAGRSDMMGPIVQGLQMLKEDLAGPRGFELAIREGVIRVLLLPYLRAILTCEEDHQTGRASILLAGEFPPELGLCGGKYSDPYEALRDIVKAVCFSVSEAERRWQSRAS
jgi:hypothetical protein